LLFADIGDMAQARLRHLGELLDDGILVWAKMKGHPEWPCIVCRDADSGGKFKKVNKKNLLKKVHIIYLEWFENDSITSNWEMATNIRIYQGKSNDSKAITNTFPRDVKDSLKKAMEFAQELKKLENDQARIERAYEKYGMSMGVWEIMDSELEEESGRNEGDHNCDQCDYHATTSDHLKKHVVAKHSNLHVLLDNLLYSCDQCDFKSKQKARLKKHESIHVNVIEKEEPGIDSPPTSSKNIPESNSELDTLQNLGKKRKLNEESTTDDDSELEKTESDNYKNKRHKLLEEQNQEQQQPQQPPPDETDETIATHESLHETVATNEFHHETVATNECHQETVATNESDHETVASNESHHETVATHAYLRKKFEKLKLELKTIRQEKKIIVEKAKEKESTLILDFNEKIKAKDEIIVKSQLKVESLEDIKTKLTTERDQQTQVIEKLEKKYKVHILEEDKDKISLKSSIKGLKEENESLKGKIKHTLAWNEKSLKEQKSELTSKGNTIDSLERDKKKLEENYKRQTKKIEAKTRELEQKEEELKKLNQDCESNFVERAEQDLMKLNQDYESVLIEKAEKEAKIKELEKTVKVYKENNTQLEAKARELGQKVKELKKLNQDYKSELVVKVLPQDAKIKELKTQLDTKTQKIEEQEEELKKYESVYVEQVLPKDSKIKALEKTVKALEDQVCKDKNSVPVSTAISTTPAPKISLRKFESLSAQPSSAAPNTLKNIMPFTLITHTDLPFQDQVLQHESDRDPQMQATIEGESRQGSSQDSRSNDSRMYRNSAEREFSRYDNSRYYSSSKRDINRESRHSSSPEQEPYNLLERQNSSQNRQNSSSKWGNKDHQDHRNLDWDHSSETSFERDRYHSDSDKGNDSSSGQERSRHSPDRDQRLLPPSPDRHQSGRNPPQFLSSNRMTCPPGDHSPSYSPSPLLQSIFPPPVPPPSYGRPLPPLPSSGPPPSRMAPALATAQSSDSAMEKELFDGLKEALEDAKQNQNVEDLEQKYDEFLNNLLESMPDKEEQVLIALDRAFLVVFGRRAMSRPNRGMQNTSTIEVIESSD